MKHNCRGCTKRHPHCHSECESYLAYREQQEKIYEERKRQCTGSPPLPAPIEKKRRMNIGDYQYE